MTRSFFAFALAGWAALPAAADGVGPSGKTIDCYCTDKTGARNELGDMICLHVDGKIFMAQCQMSLNVPMWRKVQDGCLTASLRATGQSQPADRSFATVYR